MCSFDSNDSLELKKILYIIFFTNFFFRILNILTHIKREERSLKITFKIIFAHSHQPSPKPHEARHPWLAVRSQLIV